MLFIFFITRGSSKMLNTIINTEHVTLRLASTDDTTILKKVYDEAITCFAFAPGYEITSP